MHTLHLLTTGTFTLSEYAISRKVWGSFRRENEANERESESIWELLCKHGKMETEIKGVIG